MEGRWQAHGVGPHKSPVGVRHSAAGADQRLRVGFTRDVSGSGLCLRTEQPEPIGALVRLMLRGVDGEPEPDALARVAWSYPSDGGSHC